MTTIDITCWFHSDVQNDTHNHVPCKTDKCRLRLMIPKVSYQSFRVKTSYCIQSVKIY